MFPSLMKNISGYPSGQLAGIDPQLLHALESSISEILGDPSGKRDKLPGTKQSISNVRLALSNAGGDANKVFALNDLECAIDEIMQTLSKPQGALSDLTGSPRAGDQSDIEKMQKAQAQMMELQETLSATMKALHETNMSIISNMK